MSLSGILSGVGLCIIGLSMNASFFADNPSKIVLIPLGVIFFATGIYTIVKSNKEDEIEQIRKK